MNKRRRVTRNASCGSLGLPPNLACQWCEPSISRALQKGLLPKVIKKCVQPWASKWANHRELEKIIVHHKVIEYLGEVNVDGGILVEDYVYGKGNVDPTIPAISTIQELAELDSMSDSTGSNNAERGERGVSTMQAEINTVDGNNDVVIDEMATYPPPRTHTLIQKSKLGTLKKKAKAFDRLMKQLSTKCYNGTDDGDAMLGFAASVVPQCGYAGLSTAVPFIIGSLFVNAGVPINTESLVNSQPSDNTVQRLVEKSAVNTIILVQESLRRNQYVYISADKGNKKGNKNLAKFICWYDVEAKEVKTLLLDVNCTDENTNEIADAIMHSLKKLFPDRTSVRLYGQCTDSGGGGTKYALSAAMKERNLVGDFYLISTCSLHNLQTCLRNAVMNVLGEGGVDVNGAPVMNCMQMLHGAYNLQNWHEVDELSELWKYFAANNDDDDVLTKKFKKLEEPIMTRWWLVGACACSFATSLSIWTSICIAIRNRAKPNSASSKIASCTLNLIRSAPIMNDLYLLTAFHCSWLFPHFKYLQLGDEKAGNTPSFQGRNMLVRYYLMDSDIQNLKQEWKTNEHFAQYVSSLNQLPIDEKKIQERKLTHFFRYTEDSLHKHFGIWSTDLLFLSLFSNQLTATQVANLILGRREIAMDVEFNDSNHHRTINMRLFQNWLIRKCTVTTLMTTRILPVVQENMDAIELIAQGKDIWMERNPTLYSFRLLYLIRYSALPTNTQFTERGVKESGYVSLGRRGEANRSVLAIARSKLLPDALKRGREEISVEKKRQLQGKIKTNILMQELKKNTIKVKQLQNRRNLDGIDTLAEKRDVKQSLTSDVLQFKKERIDTKVAGTILTAHVVTRPNIYERRTGQTLTPLISGKIQYAKMKKAYNLEAVRDECTAREIEFDATTNWTNLVKMIKEHEGDNRFFTPLTNYDCFKWNSNHFDADGNPI